MHPAPCSPTPQSTLAAAPDHAALIQYAPPEYPSDDFDFFEADFFIGVVIVLAFDEYAATGQAVQVFDAEQVVVAEGVNFAVFDGGVAGVDTDGGAFVDAGFHAVAVEGAAEYFGGLYPFAVEGGFAEGQAEAVVVGNFKGAAAAGEFGFFQVGGKGVFVFGQGVAAAPQARGMDVADFVVAGVRAHFATACF